MYLKVFYLEILAASERLLRSLPWQSGFFPIPSDNHEKSICSLKKAHKENCKVAELLSRVHIYPYIYTKIPLTRVILSLSSKALNETHRTVYLKNNAIFVHLTIYH